MVSVTAYGMNPGMWGSGHSARHLLVMQPPLLLFELRLCLCQGNGS